MSIDIQGMHENRYMILGMLQEADAETKEKVNTMTARLKALLEEDPDVSAVALSLVLPGWFEKMSATGPGVLERAGVHKP